MNSSDIEKTRIPLTNLLNSKKRDIRPFKMSNKLPNFKLQKHGKGGKIIIPKLKSQIKKREIEEIEEDNSVLESGNEESVFEKSPKMKFQIPQSEEEEFHPPHPPIMSIVQWLINQNHHGVHENLVDLKADNPPPPIVVLRIIQKFQNQMFNNSKLNEFCDQLIHIMSQILQNTSGRMIPQVDASERRERKVKFCDFDGSSHILPPKDNDALSISSTSQTLSSLSLLFPQLTSLMKNNNYQEEGWKVVGWLGELNGCYPHYPDLLHDLLSSQNNCKQEEEEEQQTTSQLTNQPQTSQSSENIIRPSCIKKKGIQSILLLLITNLEYHLVVQSSLPPNNHNNHILSFYKPHLSHFLFNTKGANLISSSIRFHLRRLLNGGIDLGKNEEEEQMMEEETPTDDNTITTDSNKRNLRSQATIARQVLIFSLF